MYVHVKYVQKHKQYAHMVILSGASTSDSYRPPFLLTMTLQITRAQAISL